MIRVIKNFINWIIGKDVESKKECFNIYTCARDCKLIVDGKCLNEDICLG